MTAWHVSWSYRTRLRPFEGGSADAELTCLLAADDEAANDRVGVSPVAMRLIHRKAFLGMLS